MGWRTTPIPPSTLVAFGGRLAARRRQRGMTQDDLAFEAGLSGRAIGKYESGVSVPPLDIAVRIAAALDTTCEALWFGE